MRFTIKLGEERILKVLVIIAIIQLKLSLRLISKLWRSGNTKQ